MNRDRSAANRRAAARPSHHPPATLLTRSRCAVALLLAGCGLNASPAGTTDPPRTPLPSSSASGRHAVPAERAIAELGATSYARYCTECHGAGGGGDGPAAALLDPRPTDFRDAAYMRDQTPAYYYRAITDGVVGSSMMPWDPRLDDRERWDVAFYVWSLAVAPGTLERGRAVYAERCAQCHGAAGDGVPTARFDDPARVSQSRASVREAVARAHPGLARDFDRLDAARSRPADLDAVVEHLWAFLYAPAGGEAKRAPWSARPAGGEAKRAPWSARPARASRPP